MFSDFFGVMPITNRKELGYVILGRVFESARLNQQIGQLHGPFARIILKLYDEYVKENIDDNQYIYHLKIQKLRYDKYVEAFNYIFLRFCEEKGIEPDIHKRIEYSSQINTQYGNIISEYIRNEEYTMENLKIDYQQIVKIERRREFVNTILNQMKEHKDFQQFGTPIDMYFANYLNRYANDLNYTLPELMHDLEKKYHQIIKVIIIFNYT